MKFQCIVSRINNLQRCCVPPKTRALIGKQIIREYVYAYTAVCPENGETFSLIMPYANTESMNIFSAKFSEQYKNYRIILTMDRAGCHKNNDLELPLNIQPLLIPPHSPELDPIEHIWDYIREEFFNNHAFGSLIYVIDKLCNALIHIHSIKEKVKI